MLRKYFRDVGILGITEMLLRLKVLVLMPLLTKTFGAVNYGIWAQVSVIVSMLTPLMILGTDAAAFRFLPGRDRQEIRRGVFTLLVYYALASALAAAALWLFARPIAATFLGDAANARFVALCGGVIFTALVTGACRNFYRLIGRAGIYAAVNIVQALYSVGVTLGVVIFGGTIFEVVFWGLLADLLLSAVLLVHITLSYGLGRPDLALLLKFVRFGLPLVPAGYAIWALNLADRLFIAHYGTLQDLGVYSVVYSLGYMLINLFFNPIWLMYPPTAAELYNQGRLDELSNLFRHSTRLALGLLVPAMVGIGVLGVPIVRLFATEEFVRGASLVPLITLGYTFLMLSAYYEVALGLVERQVWSTINTGIAAVVNILLNFLLVPVWGIAGAAWVTAIGFGVQFCLSAWMGSRQVRLEFDWTFFAKACLASLGMGIALYLLPVQGVGVLALGVVAGAVVYGFLMLLLRALTPEEWKAALQVVGLGMIGRFAPVLPVSEGEGEAE